MVSIEENLANSTHVAAATTQEENLVKVVEKPDVMTTAPPPILTGHGERPEKFNGTDFKRWQQKMLFYFTTLNLSKFLKESPPPLKEREKDKITIAAIESWKHSDFLYRNYVINGIDNMLYNVYSPFKTAKNLWESQEKKYKTEDAGLKKFIVGRFLDFIMTGNKIVVQQVQERQLIMHEIESEDISINEPFQVNVVVTEKLPPKWKDFKSYLKHKCKDMSLEEQIVRLRIEEDNRSSEKKIHQSFEAKANIVEALFDE